MGHWSCSPDGMPTQLGGLDARSACQVHHTHTPLVPFIKLVSYYLAKWHRVSTPCSSSPNCSLGANGRLLRQPIALVPRQLFQPQNALGDPGTNNRSTCETCLPSFVQIRGVAELPKSTSLSPSHLHTTHTQSTPLVILGPPRVPVQMGQSSCCMETEAQL